MSNNPASLIELDAVLSTPDPDQDDALDIPDRPNVVPEGEGDEPTLCERCQQFDIQSFARSANRRRKIAVVAWFACESTPDRDWGPV